MGFKFPVLTVTGRQERVWINVGRICIDYSYVFVFELNIHLYLHLYLCWLFICICICVCIDYSLWHYPQMIPINSARRHRPLSIQPPHRITISIRDNHNFLSKSFNFLLAFWISQMAICITKKAKRDQCNRFNFEITFSCRPAFWFPQQAICKTKKKTKRQKDRKRKSKRFNFKITWPLPTGYLHLYYKL